MNPKLLNMKVFQQINGEGTITAIEDDKFTVAFNSKSVKYKYPDAFAKGMTVNATELAEEIANDVSKSKEQQKPVNISVPQNTVVKEKGDFKDNKELAGTDTDEGYVPYLVETADEIYANCKTIDRYLQSRRDPEYSFALKLIEKGTCFLVIKKAGQLRFYPSRFIGYYDNTMSRHENNENKSGIITNPQISRIIGCRQPLPDTALNKAFSEYCRYLGIPFRDKGSYGAERKFWTVKAEV